jgi:hypothetical protein
MTSPAIYVICILVFGLLFGFIYVIERSSKAQTRTGKPSHLIRISALVIGLVGIGSEFWTRWQMPVFVLPLSLILMGYAVFGWFGTFKPSQTYNLENKIEAPDSVISAPGKKPTKNKKILIGCGSFLMLLIVVITFVFVYLYQDIGELSVRAKYPDTVHVGDGFEMTLYLENISENDISVQDIDLAPAIDINNAEYILSGANVLKTDPAMKDLDIQFTGMHAFTYGRVVKPGETHSVSFQFQAIKPGEYHSDIVVYLSDATTQLSDLGITITP